MNLQNHIKRIGYFFIFIIGSLNAQEISLHGNWSFKIDPEDKGVAEEWYKKEIKEDKIKLPGSMAENGKGDEISLTTKWTGTIYDSSYYHFSRLAPYRKPGNIKIPFWLSPVKYYAGAAWYQRKIVIPKEWTKKQIELYLERPHIQSEVWIDNIPLGKGNSLVAPHRYNLPSKITAGEHFLTIKIDNRIKNMNVGPDSHSVSDHTQGNWNGIVGKITLTAKPLLQLADVQVYPDVENRKARVVISIINTNKKLKKGTLVLSAASYNSETKHVIPAITLDFKAFADTTTVIEIPFEMGDKMQLWDEFNPALYQLQIALKSGEKLDENKVTFGMRTVKTKGRFITINGNNIHLRGDLNNCEFPLTGYPPMDVEGWKKIYSTAKQHGINHFRFHSWCPPEAAFVAADEMGFYLQPEGPTWPNHGTTLGDGKFIDQYLYDETALIIKNYGNHPSFCLFASSNEPAGKNQAAFLEKFNVYWKNKDNRHIYTGASVAMSWPLYPESDYMIKSGPRSLNWNNIQPETMTDYHEKIESFSIPYITHEMGQWCVFPDFKEITQYKGVMRAKNFELFQADLKTHGMLDQAEDFLKASGKLQALCYKQEIEKSLRTANSAGFQLLGLQDFPGQGSAIIGVLNALWQEKGYITPNEWRRFCNQTVILSRIPKFTYMESEIFKANIEVYHFGAKTIENAKLNWTIKDSSGKMIGNGLLNKTLLPKGTVTSIGEIAFPLNSITTATKLKLEVSLEQSEIINDWDFWVYPQKNPKIDNNIYFTDNLDEKAEKILQKGGTVFLNAAGKVVKGKEVVQYFTPVFWNTSWFKMKPPHTLGILVDTTSKAFNDFPTSFHSDMQWWEIVNKAQVMHLEDFPAGFKPLVQPIDTWFMNRKLALIMEAKAGKGKIIVCSADLFSDPNNRIAAKQLLYSLTRYMTSTSFNPKENVDISALKALFTTPSKETWDSFTKSTPDELKPSQILKQ
ncbi:exo-beta-1,4-galactosidase [Flavobacterium denitrificans]|uniref:exo-beta-1,4-galactosidase n=1 Tax=Flavobacterium denitrificans TaxID=281361 RepID=UPI00040728D4|nr:sugar-binding domain-containing protein [Flavobacterium denitrificans]